MRLVVRDVEVVEAEREIDRVDVFERMREEREVQREEEQRENGEAGCGGRGAS